VATTAVGIGVLVASLAAAAVLRPAVLPWRVGFHVLGAFYNHRLLPLPGRRARLKELAFWKNTASATGFLITCFALPLAALPVRPDVDDVTIACAVVFFFLFELGYEVLYDLRDAEGDAVAGVRSWPVLLGPAGGAAVAVAQTVAGFVIIVVAFVASAVPWRIAVMGAAPLLQLAVVGPRLPLAGRPNRITSGVCIGITWLGAVLLGLYHLWEALGLPGSGG
jgi:4-hydroxybenzoate polyprenyltransferase